MSNTNNDSSKLRPKEHGAYAILAIPMVTAFLIAGATWPGICVAAAAVAGFLANEPLLVAWGQRGKRAQRSTPLARSRLLILLTVTILCGSAAFAIATAPVRIALVACLAAAVGTFALAAAGFYRTLSFQLFAIVGLSLPSVAIFLSGGLSFSSGLMFWGVWLLGFPATTVAVRSVIAAQKSQSRRFCDFILIPISLGVLASPFPLMSWAAPAIPMIAASWYLRIYPPPARHLKRVGWALVLSTIATGAWVAVWMMPSATTSL